MTGPKSLAVDHRTTTTVSTPPAATSPFRVLLIEERDADVQRISDWLRCSRNPFFDLESAAALPDGLRRLEGGGLDVVLVGLDLVGARGLLSLRAARAAAPDVPAIAISGTPGVAREAMHLGARDLLIRGQFTGRMLVHCLELTCTKATRCACAHQPAFDELVWKELEETPDIALVR